MTTWNMDMKFLLCVMLSAPVTLLANPAPPAMELHNPSVIEQSRHGEFLVAVDADWGRYQKVLLERATVEFRQDWARDQRHRNDRNIREEDETRIKSSVADLLHDVLTGDLTEKGGFVVTQNSGAGVMRMTPRIVDLDIIAPDRVMDRMGYSLTDSQGYMTVELDIYDAVSGKLLATTSRLEEDPRKGYLEWTTTGTNRRAGRLMLQRWSTWFFKRLDEARTPGLIAGQP